MIAPVAVLALILGTQLPTFAAGTVAVNSTSVQAVVTGATLSIHPYVNSSTHDYNASSAPCFRAANGLDQCNVTVGVNLTTLCGGPGSHCHDLRSYNFTVMGHHKAPILFYLINSDPTLPIIGLYSPTSGCTGGGCGVTHVTISLWFHVIPTSGTVSAFLQINTLT